MNSIMTLKMFMLVYLQILGIINVLLLILTQVKIIFLLPLKLYDIGHMIVVINGVLVKDSVEPFFIQSSQKRPFSLEGIGKEKWKRL